MHLSVFSPQTPWWWETLRIRQQKQTLPQGIWLTTLAQGGTLDVLARKSRKNLDLNLKAHPGDFWHIMSPG